MRDPQSMNRVAEDFDIEGALSKILLEMFEIFEIEKGIRVAIALLLSLACTIHIAYMYHLQRLVRYV